MFIVLAAEKDAAVKRSVQMQHPINVGFRSS